MVMLVYQLYLTCFGFRRKTKDYEDRDPASRFLILVPAHNEERVVGDLIRNLQEMDYPPELYDVYVIADNCDDDTAGVARSLGARVIVNTAEGPDAPTGKPLALKRALEEIGDYAERYDLLMIFDADNLVDRNMLREVNSQYLSCCKPDLIQCYLGAKNSKGNIAWFYYTSYTVSNRFFQLAKHRLGLNCAVGGTGYAISTAYVRERGGWTTSSLTEDIEIQVDATLDGRRILWNHGTRVYDEKPTRLKASIRQKIRWGQGHWYVALKNTKRLFHALAKGKVSFAEFVSTFTYLYSLSAYVIAALQLVIGLVLLLPGFPPLPRGERTLVELLVGLAIFFYSYFMLFYLADWVDNRIPFHIRTLPQMIVSCVASTIVAVISQIVGLCLHRRQNHWVKTEHTIDRTSADAQAESAGG